MKFSPDGRTLAVGTHGSVICLLSVQKGYKVGGVLKQHNAAISHIDWSKDSEYLQSNCIAYELLFWTIHSVGVFISVILCV
jgi:WD40 repeat protein